jgi:dTDP-4-dehydrorhamnose reductase
MSASVELWGGVECTVNRVEGQFYDQVRRTGHHDRPGDLDLIASLGVTAVRYPVLWERIAPDGLERADWRWTDQRLGCLRELGIRPIAGLVHHGSGPRSTDLLDPTFPDQLARYAARVAERYPWVEDYTPVNEPLTTARFSALYGHWYPHLRDDRAFVAAVLTEIKGSILAMRAVRRINPSARLIQTEDGGRTYSSAKLAYQADLENARRWLTFDLLTGRVHAGHALWEWLLRAGAPPADLDWIAANACPPDIVGLNYYLTSDRYLDEDLDKFPGESHGGNGVHAYADVEALRARPEGHAGHRRVLVDAWERYGLPVAFTEVHAGAARDDQMRWLHEAWRGAERARQEGVDVRAVTLWSLFGCVDWDCLLTRCRERYEPGAFDARSTPPRPTALASLARALASGAPADPIAAEPGWWRRRERITCGPAFLRRPPRHIVPARSTRPLLIVGANGTLGSALVRTCANRGLYAEPLGRDRLDITDALAIRDTIAELKPWAVINAAGHVRVDDAEYDADACLRLNADAPAALAAECRRAGASFVTYSSDLVFDGRARRPYVESDRPVPLNVYGISKVEAEARVRSACPDALIIRTSAFFGPADDYNFLTVSLRTLADGRPFRAADDVVVSPTYVPDLVNATLDLLLDGESGIWHLSNQGQTTWAEFAAVAALRAGLDSDLVVRLPAREFNWRAPRPTYSVLGSQRGLLLPTLDDAITRYLAETSAAREPLTAAARRAAAR